MAGSGPHHERSWLLAAAGGLTAVGAVFWAAVGLAALLEGHPWPPPPSGGLIGAILIAAHPDRPAMAWPPAARTGLPGPVLVWSIAACICATGGLAVGDALTWLGPSRRKGW